MTKTGSRSWALKSLATFKSLPAHKCGAPLSQSVACEFSHMPVPSPSSPSMPMASLPSILIGARL